MPDASYPRLMTELDQIWSQMLSEAAAIATSSGRRDVADYLRLKAANDAVRTAGVGWLIDSIIEIAGHAAAKHKTVVIEREDPHNFSHGHSNMVGTLVAVRYGVRCLNIETGWTRSPRDGIMRNGALAIAKITHFGLSKHRVDLRLVHGETLPNWIDKNDAVIDTGSLQNHIDILLEN